jgi:hypothetical protein
MKKVTVIALLILLLITTSCSPESEVVVGTVVSEVEVTRLSSSPRFLPPTVNILQTLVPEVRII